MFCQFNITYETVNSYYQMMSEVERVLNALRIQKALNRKERLDRAKIERPLVLSQKEKDQMIASNKAATQEGRHDCAEWMKLKETHQRDITPLTPYAPAHEIGDGHTKKKRRKENK